MAITFEESTIKNIIIYHHFLDGLINTKTGNLVNNVMNALKDFIKDYNLVDKIYILSTIIRSDNTYSLEFNDINYDKIEYRFHFDYKVDQEYKRELSNFKKYLSFCIFPTSFNGHLSSSIIFIKDNRLYFFILNSGEDIDYNNKIPIEIDEYQHYQLTKGIILCNNIDNGEEFNKGINNFKKILFLSFFYKYIHEKRYKTSDETYNEFNTDFTNIFFKYMKKNFKSNILFNESIINIKELDTKK